MLNLARPTSDQTPSFLTFYYFFEATTQMQTTTAAAPHGSSIPRLAIDVGNVISCRFDTDNGSYLTDTDIDSNNIGYSQDKQLDTPTMECAAACKILVQHFGHENTFILSKCKRRMQLNTVEFLSRSIQDGGNFFERTGLNPRNVLFCTKRSGGDDGASSFGPKEKLQMEPLIRGNREGPRVAMGNVGKGVVARAFGLTHLIDDREDCLLSFMLEGHLVLPYLQRSQAKDKKKNRRKKKKNNEWEETARNEGPALLHFGSHARVPEEDRVRTFLASHKIPITDRRLGEEAIADCISNWVAVDGWHGVLGVLVATDAESVVETLETVKL